MGYFWEELQRCDAAPPETSFSLCDSSVMKSPSVRVTLPSVIYLSFPEASVSRKRLLCFKWDCSL